MYKRQQYQILIIHPDSDIRNTVKAYFSKLGCYCTDAADARYGLQIAKRFPAEDLIVIDAGLIRSLVYEIETPAGKATQDVFEALKEDYRTKNIPLVLIGTTKQITEARMIYGDRVAAYKELPVRLEDVKMILETVLGSLEVKQRAKARANEIARRAVTALSLLDPRRTVFDYRNCIHALCEVLSDRPDSIRIPAMRALGKFAATEAIPHLTAVLKDRSSEKTARIAAADALADIYRQTGKALDDATFNILKGVLVEGDVDIEAAASRVLGNAPLNPKQKRELVELKRKQVIELLKKSAGAQQ